MFLRCTTRKKNGKEHDYYSLVENRRVASGRVVQRHALYLGEINTTQQEAWRKTLEIFEEGKTRPRTIALYPEERIGPVRDEEIVRIRIKELSLHRPRQWGACWLAVQLWEQLGLDRFWAEHLRPSRKGTRWDWVLQILVVYRLLDPGSEWRLYRHWFEHSAMADLLGADEELAEIHKLYECHEPLPERLGKFGLEVAKDKTKTLRFGRNGGPHNGRFDFLGFEFYWEPDAKLGYLLRTNITAGRGPEQLWHFYMQLSEVEAAFKNLKDDLALRPIYHQLEHRIEAHIFISFLAYCLHVTLRRRLRDLAPGLTPQSVLEKFATLQMLDVHLPTDDGRTVILSRYTHPEKDVQILLYSLKLELPAQPPPKIIKAKGPQAHAAVVKT